MLKKIILLSMILFVALPAYPMGSPAQAPEDERNAPYDSPFERAGVTTIRAHIIADKDVKIGSYVSPEGSIGTIEPYPAIRSEEFNDQIKRSEELYDEGKYEEAAKLMEPAYADEPDNRFVLENYARALYRFDRKKSFIVYQQLLDVINSGMASYPEKVDYVIDYWFLESYWKIATLYLDSNRYQSAKIEMLKVYYSGIMRDTETLDQLYSYLTEAYYNTFDYRSARFWYYMTMENNPNNTYVQQFRDKIFD